MSDLGGESQLQELRLPRWLLLLPSPLPDPLVFFFFFFTFRLVSSEALPEMGGSLDLGEHAGPPRRSSSSSPSPSSPHPDARASPQPFIRPRGRHLRPVQPKTLPAASGAERLARATGLHGDRCTPRVRNRDASDQGPPVGVGKRMRLSVRGSLVPSAVRGDGVGRLSA